MAPIVPPGSFIQMDESRDKVVEGAWQSRNLTDPSTFWRRETDSAAAGAGYEKDNSRCSRTRSLRNRCASTATRRRWTWWDR